MKSLNVKRSFSSLLCITLIAAAVTFASCAGKKTEPHDTGENNAVSVSAEASEKSTSVTENGALSVGEGKNKFTFTVSDGENEAVFSVSTDKTVVGDALIELGLISGDEGQYGLYVKTVNGVTYDYDKDGKYWAFYVDGEYAMSGVDSTEIESGHSYMFKCE